MSLAQLDKAMDAAELMEWVAFFKLKDDARYNEVRILVEQDKSDSQRSNEIRNFLGNLRPKNVRK